MVDVDVVVVVVVVVVLYLIDFDAVIGVVVQKVSLFMVISIL